MLASQNKIQKHKAHIEKRISELQNKLKEPPREPLSSNKKPDEQELPYRRILAQKENYIEPKEVTAIREREMKARESRRRVNPPPMPFSELEAHENKKRSIVYTDKELNKSREAEETQSMSQPIYYQRREYKNVEKKLEGEEKNELYDLMTQILSNQKNLEKEIGFLRAQWSKEQNKNHLKAESEAPNSKNSFHEPKGDQVISFQEPESIERHQTFQVVNKNLKKETKSIPKTQMRNPSARKPQRNKKELESYEQETFAINKEDSQNQESKLNREKLGQRNLKSAKKVNEEEVQQKLYDLVKNQKSRKERLIVCEQSKSQFWRQVETRIEDSEKEYKESLHRNNRQQNEHLINTNELQKKMREDLISKVHSQSNNCLYK